MNFWQRLKFAFDFRNVVSGHPSSLRDPVLKDWFGFTPNSTGLHIDEREALKSPAIRDAIRVLCESVALAPMVIYRKLPNGGKETDEKHPLWRVLNVKPNRYQTPFFFKEMLVRHAAVHGNSYLRPISHGLRAVDEIFLLEPDRTRPFWRENGDKAYEYTPKDRPRQIFLEDEVIHIPWRPLELLKAESPVDDLHETIGLSLASERYAGGFFGRGARPTLAVRHPQKLDPEAAKRLKKSLTAQVTGLDNAHSPLLLTESMELEKLTTNPDEAQMIQARQQSVQDVGRAYGVPATMIGDLSKASLNNTEQNWLSFMRGSLLAWLSRVEESINCFLLTERQRRTHFVEFQTDAIVRADFGTRSRALSELVKHSIMTPNEARAREGLPPLEGGDKLYMQIQNAPLESIALEADQDDGDDDQPNADDTISDPEDEGRSGAPSIPFMRAV